LPSAIITNSAHDCMGNENAVFEIGLCHICLPLHDGDVPTLAQIPPFESI